MSWAGFWAGQLALGALEAAVNRYLRLDPDAIAKLAALSGNIIAIDVLPMEIRVYLLPELNGLRITQIAERVPDTILRGTPLALLRMRETPDRELFSGAVEVSGDVELGQRFRAIMEGIDIDWEEQIAKIFGDVAAHQIGRAARGAADWGRNAAQTLAQDLGEYLQEEARVCPSRYEIEEFLSQVDVLRMDADRLEQRVRRIEARIDAGLDAGLAERSPPASPPADSP